MSDASIEIEDDGVYFANETALEEEEELDDGFVEEEVLNYDDSSKSAEDEELLLGEGVKVVDGYLVVPFIPVESYDDIHQYWEQKAERDKPYETVLKGARDALNFVSDGAFDDVVEDLEQKYSTYKFGKGDGDFQTFFKDFTDLLNVASESFDTKGISKLAGKVGNKVV